MIMIMIIIIIVIIIAIITIIVILTRPGEACLGPGLGWDCAGLGRARL